METNKAELVKRLVKSMEQLFLRFETPMPEIDLREEAMTPESLEGYLNKCRMIARKNGFDGIILNYFSSYFDKDLTLLEFVSGMEHSLRPMQGRKSIKRSGFYRDPVLKS